MARLYVSFDNSTITALEAKSGNNYYARKGNMTGGATLKSALIAARSALSSAMYGQMDAANQNGTLGVTVPTNGFSVGGGTLSGSNLYTNSAAVWQSDPRTVRATQSTLTVITTGNSTPVSPTDAFSVSSTLYTDATTAVQDVLTNVANGPYARLGADPYRTLASVWTDHDLTYVAWDDYTPGAAADLIGTKLGTASSSPRFKLDWYYEYRNDVNPAGRVRVVISATRAGGGLYELDTGLITPPEPTNQSGTYTWDINGGAAITAGDWTFECDVYVYDAIVSANVTASSTYTVTLTY